MGPAGRRPYKQFEEVLYLDVADGDEGGLELDGDLAVFFEGAGEFQPGAAFAGEVFVKLREGGGVRPAADRMEIVEHGAEKGDGAFPNDDVAMRIADFEPDEAVAGEGGESVQAAAEGGAEVVVIQGKGSAQHELFAVVGFDADAHCAGDGNEPMEVVFDLGGVSQHAGVKHERRAIGDE